MTYKYQRKKTKGVKYDDVCNYVYNVCGWRMCVRDDRCEEGEGTKVWEKV